MIKYKLICKNCNLSFDSWFSSSNEYEKLKKKNFVTCYHCNSKNVKKTLMSPKLLTKNFKINSEADSKKNKNINKKIKEYQKFIKNNFEYVGDNFAYEARSIHYKYKKTNKRIYGKATDIEIKELKKEGIDTEVVPWIENKDN